MLGTMVACGGGGGGGGLNESVNYTGETLPAFIDTTSAVQLALDATIGTNDADGYGGGSFLSVPGNGTGGLDLARNPGQALSLLRGFMDDGGSAQPLGASVEPLSVECMSVFSSTGSVGGTMTMRICADPVEYYGSRYWMSMTLIFDEYDNGSDYQDGELAVQGTFDETIGPEGDLDGPVTVIFRDLVTNDSFSGEDSYIDGWAIYTKGTNTVSITYNMNIIDSASGDACWMDDYTILVDHVNDEVTLSGRFYDAVAGYVDLTTETVLSWNVNMSAEGELTWVEDHPTAGTVKLTGADGYWISITFSPTGFIVNVNYTGDDASDVTIGPIAWTT